MRNRLLSSFAAIALALSLSACEVNPKKLPDSVVVEVPVFEAPPAPVKVEQPYLPIEDITAESSDEDVVKAYAKSILILKTYAAQLEESLKPYLNKAESKDSK